MHMDKSAVHADAAATHREDRLLRGGGAVQRLHNQPRALVVFDVGANLANHLHVTRIDSVPPVSQLTTSVQAEAARPARHCFPPP